MEKDNQTRNKLAMRRERRQEGSDRIFNYNIFKYRHDLVVDRQ